jgi:hypothetical protein
MTEKYPHLHLQDWPFQTVPDNRFWTFVADRKEVYSDILDILAKLSRKTVSTIFLMEAYFGFGKTHMLRHIEFLCTTNHDRNLVPIYSEFPKNAKSFLDLYHCFIEKFDLELIRSEYLEICTDSNLKTQANGLISQKSALMSKALPILCMGNKNQQEIVKNWLQGKTQNKQVLQNLGILKNIDSPNEAADIIVSIVNLMGLRAPSKRIIWMIDDFHYINDRNENCRDEIYKYLTTVFNNCPHHFTILLCSSKKLLNFPKEFADRIGFEKKIIIPPLNENDAKIFILDILTHFRTNEKIENLFFPFTAQAVDEVIKRLKENEGELKPRKLLQIFNLILENLEIDLENKKIDEINTSIVLKILCECFPDQKDKNSKEEKNDWIDSRTIRQ